MGPRADGSPAANGKTCDHSARFTAPPRPARQLTPLPAPQDRLAPVVRAVRAADSPAELYSHRPSFVRFVFAHDELAALLAPQALRAWLGRLRPTLAARPAATASTELTDSTASVASATSRASVASSSSSAAVAAVPVILDSGSSVQESGPGTDRGIEFLSGAEAMDERSHMAAMLAVLQKSLHAGRALLKLVCNGERGEAESALSLTRRWACAAACRSPTLLLLCSSLPDVLQRAAHGDVCNLPLMLGALCHLQLQGALDHSSEEVSFRLLYQVFRVVERVKSARAPVLLPAFSFVYASLGQGAGDSWGRNSGDSRAVALALSSERLLALLQEAVQPPVDDESPWPPPAWPCESELLGSAWLLLSALLGCQAAHGIEVRGCISVDPLVLLAPLTGKRGASGLLQVCALQLLKTLLGLGFASPLLRIRTATAPSDAPASDVDASLRPLSLDHVTHLAVALDRHLVQPQDALALAAVSCLCALLEFTSERSGPVAHHLVSRAWFQKLPSNLATTVLMSGGNPSSALLLLSVLLQHEGIGWSGPLETQSFIEPLLRLVLQRSTSGLDPVTWAATVALLTQLVQSGRDTSWLQPREEWLRILRDPHPHQGALTDLVSIGSVTVSLRHLAECTSCCDAERRAALLLPLLS
uniref:Meiosis inhibitor protein 1-like n=1 Tax=Petromyzon marinus TaxID=7757 RepID=A0AAJ7THM0_PETMA|nr:meiosis inhibitor protein 1-like [Petromyzon marinus]